MRDIFNLLIPYTEHATLIRGSKHAAAIVCNGIVLSYGVNKLKTHPIMKLYGKNEHSVFLHAEIDAIVRCINNHGDAILKDCSLYITRTTKGGKVAGSKPCEGCQKAIEAFKIKEVIHT
jgi:tRNA(Arg) A34 adenosine deaminase TadA